MKKHKSTRHRNNSLERRVFSATLIGALVLGITMLIIGMGIHIYSLTEKYIKDSYNLAMSVSHNIQGDSSVKQLADQVMKRYNDLTEEQRQKTGTAEYRHYFQEVTSSNSYHRLEEKLYDYKESSEMNDIFLGYYDKTHKALVYICDPDTKQATKFYPGEWETVSDREIDVFYNIHGQEIAYDISYMKPYGWICTSGLYLTDDAGNIYGFVLVDFDLSNIMKGVRRFLILYTIVLSVMTLLIGLLLMEKIRRLVVDPINQIAKAAKDYVKDKQKGIQTEGHFNSVTDQAPYEIQNLERVMEDMELGLISYEQSLMRITAEKERTRTEMELAARIQIDALPGDFPAFPEYEAFDLYASMDAAKEVGGDFYDFFLIDEDHLGLVIADVSGKGVPAALFMMAAKNILATNAALGKSPAEVLAITNNKICSTNHEQMFVTAWLGILEISTGKLTAANAGHEYPALMRANQRFALFKDRHGFVLGGMEDMIYRDYVILMQPGDKIFVYTDGVTEATDSHQELFGTSRMLDALNVQCEASPQQLLHHVREAIDDFVGEAEQFDDLTMLCIAYKGKKD